MPAKFISAVPVNWAAGIDPPSQTIVIPADATQVDMVWAFDGIDANGHGLAGVTLNGATPDEIDQIPTAAGFRAATGVATWYIPATGSRALDVVWSIEPVEGPVCIVVFTKGGGTSWRDVGYDQDIDGNAVSTTLTTVVGDLVIKFDQRFDGSLNPPSLSAGWTNGTTGGNASEGCRLSYIVATDTTQVCDAEDENYSTVVAIAIAPAAGPTAIAGAGSATASGVGSLTVRAVLAGTGVATSSAVGSFASSGVVLVGTGRAIAVGVAALAVPYRSATLLGDSIDVWSRKARFAAEETIFDGSGVDLASGVGALGVRAALSGAANSGASGQGAVVTRAALAGTGGATTSGSAGLLTRALLAGTGRTQAFGNAVVAGGVNMAGVGSAAAAGLGTLSVRAQLEASAGSAAAGSAPLTVRAVLIGSGGASAHGDGSLGGGVALSGVGTAGAWAISELTVRCVLAGTGDSRTSGSAVVGNSVSLSGAGACSAQGAATLAAQYAALQAIAQAKASSSAALRVVAQLVGSASAATTGSGSVASFFVDGNPHVERIRARSRVWTITKGVPLMSLEKRTWEERLYDWDCSGLLAPDVTLASVSAMVADPADGQTPIVFGTAVINAAPVAYAYATVPAGKVVQCRVSGGIERSYILRARCLDSNGERVEGTVRLNVRDRP